MKVKDFFVKIGRRIRECFGWKSALFLGIGIAMLAADLLTKHFAEADGWSFSVIPGFIGVVNVVHNDGASLGMGGGTSWAMPLFITLTFIAVPVFIAIVLLLPERFTLLKLCLYMATAGALGNLVDRLAFGYVRDFIAMDFGFVSFVCNFADIWLMVGLVLAVIDLLFLNEWAAFPLTKKAKAAQKKKEDEKKALSVPAADGETSSERENAGDGKNTQPRGFENDTEESGTQNTGENDGRK